METASREPAIANEPSVEIQHGEREEKCASSSSSSSSSKRQKSKTENLPEAIHQPATENEIPIEIQNIEQLSEMENVSRFNDSPLRGIGGSPSEFHLLSQQRLLQQEASFQVARDQTFFSGNPPDQALLGLERPARKKQAFSLFAQEASLDSDSSQQPSHELDPRLDFEG